MTMPEIIRHLERCARKNEADARTSNVMLFRSRNNSTAGAVAAEQRRMIVVLKLYQRSENAHTLTTQKA